MVSIVLDRRIFFTLSGMHITRGHPFKLRVQKL